MPSRILIADDNVRVRRALRTLIETNSEWRVCAEAGNGREAITKAFELRPDLIVMDFCMPLLNGIQAAREIGRKAPDPPMLLCTMYLTPQLAEEARAAGFAAVVSKDTSQQLMVGIGAALRHESFFPPLPPEPGQASFL